MRVLLDANIPRDLRHHITGHNVETARYAGLHDVDDGTLLDAMAGRFDVLVTGDGSIPYQQVIAGRPIAVVLLRARGNRIEDLQPLVSQLLAVLRQIKPGQIREVFAP